MCIRDRVEAKALVTGRNLERLVIGNLTVSAGDELDGSGLTVAATISNRGTETATIPVAVISMLDERGEVLWVESQPLSTAVRSQRASEVAFDLPDVSQLDVIDVDGMTFDNGRADEDGRAFDSTVSIPVQDNSDVDSLAITVITFERGQS